MTLAYLWCRFSCMFFLLWFETAMGERARRILSLVPEKNTDSDTSDGASSRDEAGMIGSAESSPAPSINSSLEMLLLL